MIPKVIIVQSFIFYNCIWHFLSYCLKTHQNIFSTGFHFRCLFEYFSKLFFTVRIIRNNFWQKMLGRQQVRFYSPLAMDMQCWRAIYGALTINRAYQDVKWGSLLALHLEIIAVKWLSLETFPWYKVGKFACILSTFKWIK